MKETYSHEFNTFQKILQKLTGMWRINKDSIDFTWGYFAPKFGLTLKLKRFYFEKNYRIDIQLIWGYLSIKLPFGADIEESCEWDSYGFTTFNRSFHLYWGNKCKSWDFPFVNLVYESHEVQQENGNWVPFLATWNNEGDDGRYIEKHPYTHTLKNGTVQNVEATIFKERRHYHRKWLPFWKKTFTVIDVKFSGEVGERTGSWKGGAVGCGYDVLPGETMLETLRRMERERTF